MTETQSTVRVHHFVAAGCVNQWHADHDDADCLRAFRAEQKAQEQQSWDPEPIR